MKLQLQFGRWAKPCLLTTMCLLAYGRYGVADAQVTASGAKLRALKTVPALATAATSSSSADHCLSMSQIAHQHATGELANGAPVVLCHPAAPSQSCRRL